MSSPSIVFSPTSASPGQLVTASVTRDTAPTSVVVTATTPVGSASGTLRVVENLTVTVSPSGHNPTLVSDNGLTQVWTFTA